MLSDTTHPVIDVSAIMTQNHAQRPEVLSKMLTALRDRGYFYASGVDALPDNYISEVYDFLRAVHALPTEVKRAWVPPVGKCLQRSPLPAPPD
jgi:isopenicillin N synthase-like dioxygenase